MNSNESSLRGGSEQRHAKKPYHKPVIVEYGDFATLTQAVGSNAAANLDGGGGNPNHVRTR